MRKKLLVWMTAVSCSVLPVNAQFNTVVAAACRYRLTAPVSDSEITGTETKEAASITEGTSENGRTADTAEAEKKMWTTRYLSVCYPLKQIKITSPYGYRTDPFTGKRRFHNGIDLRARGEQALAMMEGVVIKVGQGRTSGKYVVLQHGNYTVSYCHLSKILVERNTLVRPRDAVGITGSTGRSTGEHLHITCKFNGKSVNPTLLFDFIKATQQECVSALARL